MDVGERHPRGHSAGEPVAELGLVLTADHEDDPGESGSQGIVDGVFQDCLAAGSDRRQLLQAPIAAPGASRQDYESRLHERVLSVQVRSAS